MRKPTRRLRHWKQRWNKNAEFIWAKQVTWMGEPTVPGKPIPAELVAMPTKLRRFWESKVIELAEFDAPNVATGQVEAKAEEEVPEVKKPKGIWDWLAGPLDGDKTDEAPADEAPATEAQALAGFEAEMADDSWLDGEDSKPSSESADGESDDSWLDGDKDGEETTDETVRRQAEVQ